MSEYGDLCREIREYKRRKRGEREPKMMRDYQAALEDLGFEVLPVDGNRLDFVFRGRRVWFYPFKQWATGPSIEDCRGWSNLRRQLVT